MTEDFVSRWARLKWESSAKPANRVDGRTTDSEPAPPGSTPAAPIDLSILPPIESICAESNVAAFLQAGVPEDLTRAALRSAWASDPGIRDFVGIAENQWDFNCEGAIAGFGALSAEEYARYVAARPLAVEPGDGGEPDRGESAKGSASNASEDSAAAPSAANPDLPGRPFAHDSVVPPQIASATAARLPESGDPYQTKRTHGSALPK